MSIDAFAHRWWDGGLGTAGTLLHVALAPAEAAYRAGTAMRNRAYDAGLLEVHRATVPVISVGNVAVGGTGKTPFSRWLAARLHERGENPAILHGGYAADEPALHRHWAPDTHVAVNRDRVAGAAEAAAAGASVVVLDDGFQHRRLHRDLDIVLVSAETWSGSRRVLPRGPYREDPGALERAGLIVVTRKSAPAAHAEDVAARIEEAVAMRSTDAAAATSADADPAAASAGARPAPRVMIAHIRAVRWVPASQYDSGAAAVGPAASAGTRPAGPAVLVSALAQPRLFEENARALGADVARVMTFPDHHEYTAGDAAHIVDAAAGGPLLTTEKDWMKLRHVIPPAGVWLLEQDVTLERGAALLDSALERVLRRPA